MHHQAMIACINGPLEFKALRNHCNYVLGARIVVMHQVGTQVIRTIARIKRGDSFNQFAFKLRNKRKLESAQSNLVVAGKALSPVQAEINQAVDLHQLRSDLLSELKRLLKQFGIQFRVVTHVLPPFIRVIVGEHSRTALNKFLDNPLPQPHWALKATANDTWRLDGHYSDRFGHLITGIESSIGLEIWSTHSSRNLADRELSSSVTPYPRNTAGYSAASLKLDDDDTLSSDLPVLCFGKPVDIVYTWVDSSDPRWQRRRDAALSQSHSDLHPHATDPVRFSSIDELRYSLRSVFTYANWVRKIYIVTDQQIPAWLDPSHPKIKIVDHHDILPSSVFNSHAIESRLQHIPGLAEHFLYLNDDVFFGSIAYPEDFFASPTVSKFFPSDLPLDPQPATPDDPPIMAAAKNGRDLLKQQFSKQVQFKIRHSIHPQQRSVLTALEHTFPAAFNQVAHSPFRSSTDISVASSLAHWYGYLIGRAVPADLHYLYLDIGHSNIGKVLDALYSLRRYDTFCLNQESTTSHSSQGREEVVRFLQRYFPYPAPWEHS